MPLRSLWLPLFSSSSLADIFQSCAGCSKSPTLLSVVRPHANSPLTILGRHKKNPNLGFVVTALAEITGKFIMGKGVASSFRPRRYYKIPKETLEASLDDLEQLINFFVIEFQRILFAENPIVTIAVSRGISYFPLRALVTESNSTLLRHSLLPSSPTTSSRSFLFGAWPSSAPAPSSSDH